MGQVKTVLFDLGNVLLDIDLCAFWSDLGLNFPEETALVTEGFVALTGKYETGHLGTADYLSGLKILFDKKFTLGQLQRAFSRILRKPIAGMSDIVFCVARTHRTALVSNTNEIHYRLSQKRLSALGFLQKHYLSYQLQVMKPAAGFYEAIIQDQGMIPSELLFIDDLAENVRAARVAGMQTIHFKSPAQLKTALQSLHILAR